MCGEIETLGHISLDEMSPLINSLPSYLWEPHKGGSRKFVGIRREGMEDNDLNCLLH